MTFRRKDPPDRATDAQALLAAVAGALNACERAGVKVKLRHGGIIETRHGYVVRAPDGWVAWTMALTEFPVAAGSSDED